MDVANKHYLNREVAEEEHVDRRSLARGDFIRGLGKMYDLFPEEFRQRFDVPVKIWGDCI
jgi:hypothetical protein